MPLWKYIRGIYLHSFWTHTNDILPWWLLMFNMSCHNNGINNPLPWLCVMCSDIAPDPLEPFVFGSSCIYIIVSLFTCKYCIVILYIFVLYTGCNYIIFSLFVFIFFFTWSWGVWLLQAYIFSIYSLTSTGIKRHSSSAVFKLYIDTEDLLHVSCWCGWL